MKKFNSVKLLRSHIERLPIPKASVELQTKIVRQTERIMRDEKNRVKLFEQLDADIMDLYGLSDENRKVITAALENKNMFF